MPDFAELGNSTVGAPQDEPGRSLDGDGHLALARQGQAGRRVERASVSVPGQGDPADRLDRHARGPARLVQPPVDRVHRALAWPRPRNWRKGLHAEDVPRWVEGWERARSGEATDARRPAPPPTAFIAGIWSGPRRSATGRGAPEVAGHLHRHRRPEAGRGDARLPGRGEHRPGLVARLRDHPGRRGPAGRPPRGRLVRRQHARAATARPVAWPWPTPTRRRSSSAWELARRYPPALGDPRVAARGPPDRPIRDRRRDRRRGPRRLGPRRPSTWRCSAPRAASRPSARPWPPGAGRSA